MKYLKNIVWIRLLAAFCIAFSMWIYVDITTNPNNKRTIELSVQVTNLPAGVVIVGDDGLERTTLPKVQVQITSSQSTLNAIRADENIRAVLDCTGVGKGQQTFDVNVVADESLGFVKSEPLLKQISLQFDNIVSKTVPIVRDTSGDYLPTREYDPKVEVSLPASKEIVFTGPESIINTIAVASYTYAVTEQTVDGEKRGIAFTPKTADGFDVTGATTTTTAINVKVAMQPAALSKTVVVMPNLIGNIAPGYQITNITSEPSTVMVTTAADKIDAVKEILTAPIDVSNKTENFSSDYELLVPDIGEGTPPTLGVTKVTVRISIAKRTDPIRVKLPVAVTIVDVPDGLVFRSVPATVMLDVEIPAEAQAAQTSLEAVVSVGAWDPLSPTRQVRVIKAKGVQILNKLPSITLIAVPMDAVVLTPTPDAPADDATVTQTPTIDPPSETATAATPTATVVLTSPTATVTPPPPTATATPIP